MTNNGMNTAAAALPDISEAKYTVQGQLPQSYPDGGTQPWAEPVPALEGRSGGSKTCVA